MKSWTRCGIVDAIMDCWIQAWQAIELVNYYNGLIFVYAWRLILICVIQTQVFLESVFEVFSQTPKRGLICLLLLTKKLLASGGLARLSPDPLTRGSAPGLRWGLYPQTSVIGLRSRTRHRLNGLKPPQSNFLVTLLIITALMRDNSLNIDIKFVFSKRMPHIWRTMRYVARQCSCMYSRRECDHH